MRSLIVLAAVCLLCVPALAVAQVSVSQDSCFNMDGFVRVYFTVTNNSGGAYGVLSFTMTPNPPSASCDVIGAGAVEPWIATLGGGGMVQFLAPPYPPYYFIGDRGGFYIDITSADCCYDVSYYDQTITQVYSDNVCFASPCFDRPPIPAEPVQWPGNGLYYEYVYAPGISWSEAASAVSGRFWMGTPGSLVSIFSQEEQDWIVATFQPDNAWTDGINVGAWLWSARGVFFSYTNWCSGEPNEPYPPLAAMMVTAAGCWADAPDVNGVAGGYLVKYDPMVIPVETKTWGGVKALYGE